MENIKNLLNRTPIRYYENYHIYKDGRVINTKTGRFLKYGKDGNGYYQIKLSKNGKYKNKKIHKLLGLILPTIDHINRNRIDNRLAMGYKKRTNIKSKY